MIFLNLGLQSVNPCYIKNTTENKTKEEKTMQKTVKKIAEFVNEIASEYDLCEDTAMRVLEAAAGGIENVADWMEENVNSCSCCDRNEDDKWEDEDDEAVVESQEVLVGSQDRVTIPKSIIEAAEDINGKLDSKKNDYGALTVVKEDDKITVYFGDKTDDYEDARIVHPNARGQVCFSVAPVFDDGDYVNCSLLDDGTIVLD